MIGFIKLFVQKHDLPGWLPCDGSVVSSEAYPELFAIMGNKFGGDGSGVFALPNFSIPGGFAYLRVSETEAERQQRQQAQASSDMTSQVSPYVGDDTPVFWMECDGRLLNPKEYPVLASLVGNRFGGDGVQNFGLPQIPADHGLRYLICVQGTNPNDQGRPGDDD